MLENIGPVTMLPEKTRIAFQARRSFPPADDPAPVGGRPFRPLPPGRGREVHQGGDDLTWQLRPSFPARFPEQVAELRDLAREAHAVGRQQHRAPAHFHEEKESGDRIFKHESTLLKRSF